MATKTVTVSWLSIVSRADPDWIKEKSQRVEYEFSARGLPLEPTGDTSEFENGMRVFRANDAQRGPYAPEDDVDGGLIFNGQQLVWPTGDALVWDEDND